MEIFFWQQQTQAILPADFTEAVVGVGSCLIMMFESPVTCMLREADSWRREL